MAVLQSGHILALSAGFCAALASVFGKLAMDGGPTQVLRQPICSLLAAVESDCQSQASAASQLSEKVTDSLASFTTCLSVLCSKAALVGIINNVFGGRPTQAVMGIRMALFCLVFVTNGFMWTLFSKSLALCTSSMEATVINSAANFLFTVCSKL
jgi:hypothetical protein